MIPQYSVKLKFEFEVDTSIRLCLKLKFQYRCQLFCIKFWQSWHPIHLYISLEVFGQKLLSDGILPKRILYCGIVAVGCLLSCFNISDF